MIRKIIMLLTLAVIIPAGAIAETATFQWDKSQSADVAGYRLYWKDKTSGALTKLGADVMGKDAITATVEIPAVEGAAKYAVVAKAFDLAGNESAESNEATKDGTAFVWKDVTPPAAPGTLQVLQQIAAALERIANTLDRQ